MIRVSCFSAVFLLLAVSIQALNAGDDTSLPARIDRLIESATEAPLAPASTDAEFVRRLYLDLVGRIPTVEETRAFLADDSAKKREELIDRLLASDEHPRRLQELFHVMLMERLGDNEHWTRFLRHSAEQNRPWNELAAAILKPQPDDPQDRGAAYFFTSRLVSEGAMAPVDVPGLTRDVGRLLAGVDLKCAQCHDHLSIDHYNQRDFQGLHMIFENVKAGRGDVPSVSEGLMTEPKEFMSVFVQEPVKTQPLVPGGEEIEIPKLPEGEEYEVPPDRKKRQPGVPKFSPLQELARGMTAAENRLFSRNIANRLWFVMMGRGLVEPLDLHHPDNPASHPELLDLLAEEFSGNGFDVRWMLRQLARTQTYQRTSVVKDAASAPPPESFAVALEKRLTAEQLFWSMIQATGELDRLQASLETDSGGQAGGDSASAKQEEKKTDDEEKEDSESDQPPPLPQTKRERLLSQSDDLQKLHKLFLKYFANQPKEPEVDFEPTVAAALFVLNDDRFLRMLNREPGNLTDRLSGLDDADEIADELFLTVLSRPAREEEQQMVAGYLKKHPDDRQAALRQLIWAALASTEFCVNH